MRLIRLNKGIWNIKTEYFIKHLLQYLIFLDGSIDEELLKGEQTIQVSTNCSFDVLLLSSMKRPNFMQGACYKEITSYRHWFPCLAQKLNDYQIYQFTSRKNDELGVNLDSMFPY